MGVFFTANTARPAMASIWKDSQIGRLLMTLVFCLHHRMMRLGTLGTMIISFFLSTPDLVAKRR